MPSARRFSFLPVIVAGSAAAGGILGAFVAVGLVATPASRGNVDVSKPAAHESKAAPKPEAKTVAASETTGSAPPGESVASAGCDQQTWPYLSRSCREELQRKNRNVRVIATDKLDKPTVNAIENPPSATGSAPSSQPQTPAPVIAATTPAAAEPMPVTTSGPWFNPAATAAPTTAATTSETPKQPAGEEARDEAKAKDDGKAQAKQVVKAKRKSKAAPKVAPGDDDDATTVASGDDDRGADRSSRPRRHIVERWIERAADSDGGRTVVIRRGGLFENLFGMNRARDDD